MKKYILVLTLFTILFLSACDLLNNEEYNFVLGDSQDTIEINTDYEPGGAWLEYKNEKITYDTTTGHVDITTLGLYELVYNLEYEGISYSITRYVIVVDQTAPVITLNEGVDTIYINSSWIDSLVTVIDNSLEDITYTVTGSVDETTAGIYEIIYTASDSSGNTSTTTRYVTVFE